MTKPEVPSPKTVYVVAVNQHEAEMLADEIGHRSRRDAEAHLALVKSPPTDPLYAAQYKIFAVRRATQ